MKCKNCYTELDQTDKFCSNCGAKVMTSKITTKLLFQDFLNNFLGWDNSFFKTVRFLILRPEVLLKEYISGVRKRYMNPFVFLALGTAISLFIFNSYSEVFMASYSELTQMQIGLMNEAFGEEVTNSQKYQEEIVKNKELTKNSIEFTIKYFNIITFLFVPLYAFMSYLIFGRRYNFGEYIIITCYIQGVLFYSTILFFILSIFFSPQLFTYSILITIPFYLYVFGRLMKLSLWSLFLKLLVFFAVTTGISIAFVILVAIVTIAAILLSNLF